jgi:hypothetical protein
MIKFFRKIRQKLLTENKFSKYLIYAIGEIILVVIGILIALSINNWNDIQKNNNQEILLLKSLKSEFKNNTILFDSIFKNHKTKEDYVLKLININKEPIPFTLLDSILEIITYNYTTNLSSTIYKSSMNSGKIELIKNTELKNRITSFEDQYKDFQEEELIAQELTNNQIIPFINDNVNVRYPFGERNEKELQQDVLDYKKLVTNINFRNRLITLKGVCWDVTLEGKVIREQIEKIINEIDTVLKNK